ncbi:hypothetical protein F4780DRAFT_545328 [Xylariomycetidae sp. FL0641]|nr:hypothetical protein F4780DRAFT_545328 [Xylariomycetidae sp. FL0641]
MGIASGIGHFFESIVEVLQGIVAAIVHAFQIALNSVVHLFQTALHMVMSLFSGFVNFVEGTLGFAIHNFFILGTVAAAVFGYMLYTQRQGSAPVSRTVKSKST